MTTELEQQVIDAARDWLTDRVPMDYWEKRLAIAVAKAWPEQMGTREHCTCDERDTCDECPTNAQAAAIVASWEREVAAASQS